MTVKSPSVSSLPSIIDLFDLSGSFQLGLNLLDSGQCSFQLLGKTFEVREFGDAEWFPNVAQRVLGYELILRFTQDEADGRLVVRVTEHIVHRGKIEVELAGVLGHPF